VTPSASPVDRAQHSRLNTSFSLGYAASAVLAVRPPTNTRSSIRAVTVTRRRGRTALGPCWLAATRRLPRAGLQITRLLQLLPVPAVRHDTLSWRGKRVRDAPGALRGVADIVQHPLNKLTHRSAVHCDPAISAATDRKRVPVTPSSALPGSRPR